MTRLRGARSGHVWGGGMRRTTHLRCRRRNSSAFVHRDAECCHRYHHRRRRKKHFQSEACPPKPCLRTHIRTTYVHRPLSAAMSSPRRMKLLRRLGVVRSSVLDMIDDDAIKKLGLHRGPLRPTAEEIAAYEVDEEAIPGAGVSMAISQGLDSAAVHQARPAAQARPQPFAKYIKHAPRRNGVRKHMCSNSIQLAMGDVRGSHGVDAQDVDTQQFSQDNGSNETLTLGLFD